MIRATDAGISQAITLPDVYRQTMRRSMITLILLAVSAVSGCTSAVQPDSPPISTVRYVGNNVFVVSIEPGDPGTCVDAFADAEQPSSFSYWDAVARESCYQMGMVPLSPPIHDCSDRIPPGAPSDAPLLAGVDVVVDIRNNEIVAWSHVVGACIPLDGF